MARNDDHGSTDPNAALDPALLGPDPIAAFEVWMQAAWDAGIREAHAMALATVGADGAPSCRMVLLKGFDERGFCFYTHQESRKGRELRARPRAALTFWWGALERQVRIEGAVEPVEDATADRYFATRPRPSQISAWASPQSQVVPDRADLERRLEEVEARFADQPVPRPPFWGGHRVVPERIEFWQGRPGRTHDRVVFERSDQGWSAARLAP